MKAIKIKMKRNCGNSGDVQDIESIYMDQNRYILEEIRGLRLSAKIP